MTDQQTDLSPRELDAALAVAFGAEKVIPYDTNEGYFFISFGQDKDGGGICEPLHNYSTTGDGMLLVLEAMRERGYGFEMTDDVSTGQTGWEVQVWKDSSSVLGWLLHAETLPRAVALAALAAMKVE